MIDPHICNHTLAKQVTLPDFIVQLRAMRDLFANNVKALYHSYGGPNDMSNFICI